MFKEQSVHTISESRVHDLGEKANALKAKIAARREKHLEKVKQGLRDYYEILGVS